MKIPAPVILDQVSRSTLEKAVVPSVPKVPPVSRGASSFQSALNGQLNAPTASRNMYAAPGDLSVSELTDILRREVNEHLLSVLASTRPGGAPSERSSSIPLRALSTIAGRGTGHIVPPVNEEKNAGDLIEKTIARASRKFGVDENLVRAVIKAESDFRPDATSPKGAMGLMQLMPGTARDMGVENAYDPVENIMGGVKYLKMLLDRYEGNVDRALAAYNWGMGNLERSNGGLPEEPRTYLSRISRFYETYSGSSRQTA